MKKDNRLKGKPVIIIPTIRSESFFENFLEEWKEDFAGCHLIVIEDRKKKILSQALSSKSLNRNFTYDIYDWTDIDTDLDQKAWIIPRQSDAIRSYGFLKAWQGNALFCVTLDDDVRPGRPGHHIQEFGKVLLRGIESNDPLFFSTLKNIQPRGTEFDHVRPKLVHGMWLHNLDLAGNTQLENHHIYGELVEDELQGMMQFNEGIVPRGALFSMCSMNVAWATDITKQMYFGLQGNYQPKIGKPLVQLPLDRCGDIWTGYHVKRFLDEIKEVAFTGRPYVIHERASNVWKNIEREEHGWIATFSNAHFGEPEGLDEHEWYYDLLKKARVEWESLFESE